MRVYGNFKTFFFFFFKEVKDSKINSVLSVFQNFIFSKFFEFFWNKFFFLKFYFFRYMGIFNKNFYFNFFLSGLKDSYLKDFKFFRNFPFFLHSRLIRLKQNRRKYLKFFNLGRKLEKGLLFKIKNLILKSNPFFFRIVYEISLFFTLFIKKKKKL